MLISLVDDCFEIALRLSRGTVLEPITPPQSRSLTESL
jgi:hypothetical protein